MDKLANPKGTLVNPQNTLKLPKGTLRRLTLGQSFAEYDLVLGKTNVFVETPAMRAALDAGRPKSFLWAVAEPVRLR